MATKKKAAAKKSSKKKVVARRKAPAKKPSRKKVSARKVGSKVKPRKKSAVKSRSAKKTSSSKSASAKRSSVKRKKKSSRPSPSTYQIPTVPLPRTSKSGISALSTKRKFDFTSDIDSSEINSNYLNKPARQNSRKSKSIFYIFLILLLAASLAILVKGGVKSSNVQQPNTENSASPVSPATSSTFKLSYQYNSTGVSINFASANQLGNISKFRLLSAENGQESKELKSLASEAKTVDIVKIDTVGKTVLTVEATMADGSKITSKPLKLDGLFDKN
jgi:hypothetical protein